MTILEALNKIQSGNLCTTVYKPQLAPAWNSFVADSKNGTFLFHRNYMDYHKDRFVDHSLLFHHNKQLVAVMPANISDNVLYSHAGLTYGGVLSGYNMTAPLMLNVFEELKRHCEEHGIKKVVYKAIPSIYHCAPSEEDLYALFRNGAKLIGRNLSSSIFLPTKKRFHKKRREAITKAKNHNLTVKQSFDFEGFMGMVEHVVNGRHGAKPVHSGTEMLLLAQRFPKNIKLFGAFRGDKMLAGCLIYECRHVAHGQYAANLDEVRLLGAQDLIIDYLVNSYYEKFRFFDFGISTLNLGQILNEGLVKHKASFGASGVVYDFYEFTVK